MNPRSDPSPELRRLIAAQAGVVTREQAVAHGLSRRAVDRLVAQRLWSCLAPGVFWTSSGPSPWLALAWAGVLMGGDDACLGGESAAYLEDLSSEPRTITVLIPAGHRRPRADDRWEFVRTRRELRSHGTPPRTFTEETVLDLCADPDRSLERVVGAVTDAVQQRRATAASLRRALAGRARHPRRSFLTELLADVAVGARSPLEIRYLRDVERAHGLPAAQRQVIRRRTEVDVLYRAQRLLVELDGRLGHAGSGKFRDMHRDNNATEDALATLRYGYADVTTNPCAVAEQVATVLRLRGWGGRLVPCAECLHVA